MVRIISYILKQIYSKKYLAFLIFLSGPFALFFSGKSLDYSLWTTGILVGFVFFIYLVAATVVSIHLVSLIKSPSLEKKTSYSNREEYLKLPVSQRREIKKLGNKDAKKRLFLFGTIFSLRIIAVAVIILSPLLYANNYNIEYKKECLISDGKEIGATVFKKSYVGNNKGLPRITGYYYEFFIEHKRYTGRTPDTNLNVGKKITINYYSQNPWINKPVE